MSIDKKQIDMRRDLSLDLEKSKMSVDETSPSSNKQNTPNLTSDSTSQSMTPSEFGYQHLNRPSNVVSLDSSPKSDVYETLEQAFKHCDQSSMASTPIQTLQTLPPTNKLRSPIKATINITYNVKSPQRTSLQSNFVYTNEPDPSQFPDYEPVDIVSSTTKPLETSFDENVIYEQVKFFKGAISEVNHLLNNGNHEQKHSSDQQNEFLDSLNTPQVVPTATSNSNAKPSITSNAMNTNESSRAANESIADDKSDSGDVLMPDQELTQDSLEFDPNLSMYENVNLRKPTNAYENISMRSGGKTKSLNFQETTLSLGKENNKPGNFTVKQLANKFETSPVDAMAPFDFSKPFLRKNCDTNRSSANTPKVKNPQHLNKASDFTRSLDENAFVREFGSGRSNEKVNKSTQQIPIVTNVLTENSPIRRSINDPSRPKSLNPPKRLPNLSDTENEMCKPDSTSTNPVIIANYDVKITPTNENPISLIQHNVDQPPKSIIDDERNKFLGNFNLDRERIERIKEERRLQLNEKFRSESFKCEKENNKIKSKSKIELNELKDADKKISDSLQYKSKSRNEIYNTKDADSSVALTLCSAKDNITLGRIHRLNDDKNQNDTDIDEQSVAFRTRKFDRRSVDIKREQDHFNTSSNGSTIVLRSSSYSQ